LAAPVECPLFLPFGPETAVPASANSDPAI
jgi:hypothetical protein